MKKVAFLVTLISVFVLVGCSFGGNKIEKYQEVLEEYGRDYYSKYQKEIRFMTNLEVTIDMLKDANNPTENYDLEKLKKCKGNSKIMIEVDEETREIKKVEFEMDCEK
ncbi:MAG: hypothetical protein PHW32_00860 [Bacilli bacterium]|nr:hypothetical protein [Bacilli bacterium]MDD4283004.1 hypothetical protein [Bacilli bacterium]MDD4718929.1 hypothetical protein [Bacilli bacterium]